MPSSDKTRKMPAPKTTKLDRSQISGGYGTGGPAGPGASASASDQATQLKRNASANASTKNGGNSGNAKGGKTAGAKHSKKKKTNGKKVAIIVVIVLLVAALLLSLAWGFGLFKPKEEVKQEETTQVDDKKEENTTPDVPSGDSADVTYTRYATGDLSLEYPSNWSVMNYQGAQTVVVTRGTVKDGFIKLAQANVSDYGVSSVTSASTMKSFVKAIIDNEKLGIDIDSVAITQRGDEWVASLTMSTTTEGVSMQGVQLVGAQGNSAYLITAQCPSSTYQKNWSYFQHILDSIKFATSADFPDEGRD